MAQRGRGETPQSSSSSASSSTPSPSLMLSSSSSPLSSICCEHHHHHQTQQKYLHHHDQNHCQDKQHQHFELGNHPYFTFIIMVNPGLVRKGTLHTAQLFVAYSKDLFNIQIHLTAFNLGFWPAVNVKINKSTLCAKHSHPWFNFITMVNPGLKEL